MRATWLGLLVVAAVAIALAIGRLDAERQDPASGLEAAAPVIADAAAPDSPPAGIGRDACRELEPRGQEHGRTVFIDPGHGRPDPGTAGRTPAGKRVFEKDLTLATALRLAGMLQEQGYRVVLARTTDSSVASLDAGDLHDGVFTVAGKHKDLLARIACANATHADLVLSLHFNGYDDPGSGGTETFYNAVRPFAAENRRLARLVQEEVVGELTAEGWTVRDRGARPDATDQAPALSAAAAAYPYLLELGPAQAGYLDEPSRMPGVLCEPLFLTNPREAGIAASRAGQAAIARGLARAVDRFFADSATDGPPRSGSRPPRPATRSFAAALPATSPPRRYS